MSSDDELPYLPKLGEIDLNRIANFSIHNYWFVKDPERFKALMEEAL